MSIEQRVERVEARMAENSQLLSDLRQGLLQFEQRVDRRFEQIDRRFEQIETRITALDHKLDTRLATLEERFDTRLVTLEQKFDGRFVALEQAMGVMRRDMATHFRWTAGIMLTGLVGIIAATLTLAAAVLSR